MIGHSYTFLEPSQVSEEHTAKLSCMNGRMVCIIKVFTIYVQKYLCTPVWLTITKTTGPMQCVQDQWLELVI